MKRPIFYLLDLAVRWADQRTNRFIALYGDCPKSRGAGRLELRLVRWRSKFR